MQLVRQANLLLIPLSGEVIEPDGLLFLAVHVELAEGVRIESRLTESAARHLSIGMEMELTLEPFGTDDQGREIVTFAFKPVTGSS